MLRGFDFELMDRRRKMNDSRVSFKTEIFAEKMQSHFNYTSLFHATATDHQFATTTTIDETKTQ